MTTRTVYEVPTQPQPAKQTITLNGTVYQIKLRWCEPASCWMMDILDQSGNLVLGGTPLVTGADLLAQYEYLGIAGGGSLVVQSDNEPDLVPDYITLGSTGHLFFIAP